MRGEKLVGLCNTKFFSVINLLLYNTYKCVTDSKTIIIVESDNPQLMIVQKLIKPRGLGMEELRAVLLRGCSIFW